MLAVMSIQGGNPKHMSRNLKGGCVDPYNYKITCPRHDSYGEDNELEYTYMWVLKRHYLITDKGIVLSRYGFHAKANIKELEGHNQQSTGSTHFTLFVCWGTPST
jgi:hypothetical protein